MDSCQYFSCSNTFHLGIGLVSGKSNTVHVVRQPFPNAPNSRSCLNIKPELFIGRPDLFNIIEILVPLAINVSLIKWNEPLLCKWIHTVWA